MNKVQRLNNLLKVTELVSVGVTFQARIHVQNISPHHVHKWTIGSLDYEYTSGAPGWLSR